MHAAENVLIMCCFTERSLSKMKPRLQMIPINLIPVFLREIVGAARWCWQKIWETNNFSFIIIENWVRFLLSIVQYLWHNLQVKGPSLNTFQVIQTDWIVCHLWAFCDKVLFEESCRWCCIQKQKQKQCWGIPKSRYISIIFWSSIRTYCFLSERQDQKQFRAVPWMRNAVSRDEFREKLDNVFAPTLRYVLFSFWNVGKCYSRKTVFPCPDFMMIYDFVLLILYSQALGTTN